MPLKINGSHLQANRRLPNGWEEVASDADRFTGLFLTYYCKALSNAFDDKMDFHNKKNRVSISLENKYPVVIKHRELASSQSL